MLLDVKWTETKNQIVDTKMAMALLTELQKRGITNIGFTVVPQETT